MPTYLPRAEPFFFQGDHVGCLLLHGFTGTPYEMRELGERLAAVGYTVLGPALAGHATCREDMMSTRWPDWYASASAAFDQLQEHCNVIFPIGLSMGALLALHLAAHRPVAGVVAVSAPIDIHNPLIPLFTKVPILFRLVPLVKKNPKNDDTVDPAVRLAHPAYDGNPTRCAASLIFDLIPHVRADLADIRAPALLIQARGDRVVPRDSLTRFYSLIGSTVKQMLWLEKGGHLALEDYDKETAFAAILEFVHARHAQVLTGESLVGTKLGVQV